MVNEDGLQTRGNGLATEAPRAGLQVLVTGGAGYIGCVLVERLLDRGYSVRVLDRLYWGEEPLEAMRDRLELTVADVRDLPASALDGVDAVIHLAGLSNDPTAEYDPDANWQMNALGTEALAKACASAESSASCSPRPAPCTTAWRRACTTKARPSSRAAPMRPPSATRRRGCWSSPATASAP